jgi:hypothetical protein
MTGRKIAIALIDPRVSLEDFAAWDKVTKTDRNYQETRVRYSTLV